MPDPARVGVVVVDYKGGGRTLACLHRLHELTWPADRLHVVVVDNGAAEGAPTPPSVRERWPAVEVVVPGANLGFAGGCNAGFDRLRAHRVDHVAIVNNDALPHRGWLEPLVAALDGDPTAGAAMPKVLLSGDYVRLVLTAAASAGVTGDPRALGVQVSAIEVDGRDVLDETLAAHGLWGWERDDVSVGGRFRWTGERAELFAPVAPAPAGSTALRVRLSSALGVKRATVNGVTADVGPDPTWVDVPAQPERLRLVNSTGLELRANGAVGDRGYLEPDGPAHALGGEVFGWSGAAVLLRRGYVDDLAGFDERLFLYYEDADLSWRGLLRGWRYLYVPASVVEHEHSASVGNVSLLADHLVRRNRLVVLTKDAPAPVAAAAAAGLVADLARAGWRDLVVAPLSGRGAPTEHARRLGRVLAGYLRLLPGTLVRRRRTLAGRTVDPAEVVRRWER